MKNGVLDEPVVSCRNVQGGGDEFGAHVISHRIADAAFGVVSAYWMLKRDEPYHDLGTDWHTRRNDEAHTRRLITQLEHLGHTVIINPAA